MDFDEWSAHPYTKVLEESIAKDYVPRTDLIAAEREACAKVIEGMPTETGWIGKKEAIRKLRERSNISN